ncbi:MAG TPA: hypothetical protein DIS66_03180 [Candidatus Omnitrophica bacterium]|nr:hypothetical protein [Candidatus Omnitrophota bacterium]
MMKFLSLFSLVAVSLLFSSCASSSRETGIGNSDPASYGLAKKKLIVNETTQQEVIHTFGAPNITTKGTNGIGEVWTYEKVSSEYAHSQASVGAGGGASGGGSNVGGGGLLFGNYGQQKGSTSVRTVTLIITFDEREVVKDYRIMETNF